MSKATPEDWNLFVAEFDAWQKKLGLTNWEIEHCHRKMNDARAKTEWSLDAMAAKITFSDDWDNIVKNPYEICHTAFHESLEVLLAELSTMAMESCAHDKVSQAIHSVIHRLENAFFVPITIDNFMKVAPSGLCGS